MFSNANTATASVAPLGLSRRSLLGMVVLVAAPLSRRALAEPASADATSAIKHLNEALLAAGSISRVAVQRSDFRRILSNGGGNALLASLQRKTSDLSGGALV